MRNPGLVLMAGVILFSGSPGLNAGAGATKGDGRLMTRWAREVGPDNALPEYPRPLMVRKDWKNLNGLWEYAVVPGEGPEKPPDGFGGRILVPFGLESPLSGVGRRLAPGEALWYRRYFAVPNGWRERRILLHFGAVDWECRIRVNGKEAGSHKGGYDPFAIDVTDLLKDGGNELIVFVKDPTSSGDQPRGKQNEVEGGINYTSTSGIWQTVWLEPVPAAFIGGLKIVPDVDRGLVAVAADCRGAVPGDHIAVAAGIGGEAIAAAVGEAEKALELKIPRARLWSPDDPFLYYLTVELKHGGAVVDRVESYFAMRKIAAGPGPDGLPRLLLNGRPVFQFGWLDQGFWPDGIYTAPTDEALRYDIEAAKKLGMNLIRKHVKVEPSRWYYHCDRLGMLVWQDMPSGETGKTAESRTQFKTELKAMIDLLRNHPSVVAWIPFNEGWGQHESVAVADWVKAYDPSRLVTEASGWEDHGAGDIRDVHSYPAPDFYEIVHSRPLPAPDSRRPLVIGECGGVGINIPGHLWNPDDGWGWLNLDGPRDLTDFFVRLLDRFHQLKSRGLSAVVYTQATDVETECNGLMTYDRAAFKLDVGEAAAAARRLRLTPAPVFRTLVPTSIETPQEWKFATTAPAAGWMEPGFDDRGWKSGPGVFGFVREDKKKIPIRTEWKGREIYLRRTFSLSAVPEEFAIRICHDEEAEVYINGTLVKKIGGWKEREGFLINLEDVPAGPGAPVFRTGENVLAVHTRQTSGSQVIDVGLLESRR